MQTKQDILNKIGELELAAEGLSNWKKRNAILKIGGLKMRVESLILDDIANLMLSIDTSGIAKMNEYIQKSQDAQLVQKARVKNLNKAIDFLKKVLIAIV
ncbi:hypothetical protein BCU30_018180 [Vibrio lentus]|uniref:hypothetical protein n=1 Tax=Vibrio lentus TaxID=136468 RepID=UPI000C844A3D|nr:hypothetical protein [Vibrio lentus]PMG23176.1 hypothetical protein BCU96_14110 [Vibrio lentus]PMH13322.1 hypothetical protein BCU76_22015 [Vibrio lentus]PMJ12985.1 hypothetical protein BCU30_12835 [Vibrio lentus]PMK95606.1 hypothetical protein BCT89_13790 [Vibrio lentus]PML48186.1 hypothetical protein BCT75_20540 [Vibrio lentus]